MSVAVAIDELPGQWTDSHPRVQRREFTAEMLRRAAQTQDPAEREEILDEVIVANICVARSIASRYRSRGIALEDLEQVANAALVRAVHRYREGEASDFLAYAVPSIRGEVRRYFRDCGWMVRPPRRVQELQTHVLRVREELRAVSGEPPTVAAIARELSVDDADVGEALSAEGCFTPTSLDQPVGEDAASSMGELIPDPHCAEGVSAAEARLMLRPVVRQLSDRDRTLLHLRFFEDRTQQEIADEFGVTQTQVSRLLSRVLGELRDQLADDDADEPGPDSDG